MRRRSRHVAPSTTGLVVRSVSVFVPSSAGLRAALPTRSGVFLPLIHDQFWDISSDRKWCDLPSDLHIFWPETSHINQWRSQLCSLHPPLHGDSGIRPFCTCSISQQRRVAQNWIRNQDARRGSRDRGKMVQSEAADGSSPSFQDPARLCQIGTGAAESRK